MKTYKMTIAGLERHLPICPVNENLSIGAFVIFGDPELTTACAKALLERAPAYDYLISAEAKGIPWCTKWRALRAIKNICWHANPPSFI